MISAQKAFAQYIDLYKDSVAHVSVSPMLTALNRSALAALEKAVQTFRHDPMECACRSMPRHRSAAACRVSTAFSL